MNKQIRELLEESINKLSCIPVELNQLNNLIEVKDILTYTLGLVQPSQEEITFDLYKSDPIFFIENCLEIKTPTGRIPFKLYDWQKEFINTAQKQNRIFVKKPRQVGFTTVQCAYLVWKYLFSENQSIVVISKNVNHIRDIIYDMLDYCRIVVVTDTVNKSKISFKGNSIDFISDRSIGSGVRGKSFSTIFIDECEFVDSNIIPCLYPCLHSKGSQFIVGSTSGIYPWTNILNWHELKVNWDALPNRDVKWLLNKVRELGVDVVERELM